MPTMSDGWMVRAAPARLLWFLAIAVASACGSPKPVCTPGQSISCVGIGGCPGGQACNAAGTGFDTCLCGSIGDGGAGDAGSGASCAVANGGCDPNAYCTSTAAGRICTCPVGFAGDGLTCVGINECLTNNGGCHADATCSDTPGSRSCACNVGFVGDGFACADVDECATNNGGCDRNADCTNTRGSWSCACRTGFQGDGGACADTDECLNSNGGCDLNAVCTNTPGSRLCTCGPGYSVTGLACGESRFTSEPTSLEFGDTYLGESTTRVLVARNVGGGPTSVTDAMFAPGRPSAPVVTGSLSALVATYAPDASLSTSITFTPQALVDLDAGVVLLYG